MATTKLETKLEKVFNYMLKKVREHVDSIPEWTKVFNKYKFKGDYSPKESIVINMAIGTWESFTTDNSFEPDAREALSILLPKLKAMEDDLAKKASRTKGDFDKLWKETEPLLKKYAGEIAKTATLAFFEAFEILRKSKK